MTSEPTLFVADRGPAPEPVIARDLLHRALPVMPLAVAAVGIVRGVDGALSAGTGLALVVANFLLAAVSLAWAARVNLAILMATALFGYVARLGLLFLAVLAIRDLDWVDMPALGVTLIVAHLGFLFWELRYVSVSLAFPDLKPARLSATASTEPVKERSR